MCYKDPWDLSEVPEDSLEDTIPLGIIPRNEVPYVLKLGTMTCVAQARIQDISNIPEMVRYFWDGIRVLPRIIGGHTVHFYVNSDRKEYMLGGIEPYLCMAFEEGWILQPTIPKYAA